MMQDIGGHGHRPDDGNKWPQGEPTRSPRWVIETGYSSGVYLGPQAPAPDPRALWRVLVDTLEILPDAELIERDDWVQLRTPSSPHPWHNTIVRARLEPAEMRARVADVRDEHLARGAGLRWIVGLGSGPPELSTALVEAGIGTLARTLGMARAVPSTPLPSLPRGVHVRLATPADIDLLGEVGARGWQRSPAFGTAVARRARRIFEHQADVLFHWLAFLDGEPVGSSALRILPQLGYMQGACVVPEARGRGVYTALSWIRLAELRRRTIPHAVIWADESTSAPTAHQMGFRAISSAMFHEMEPPEP